jgi:hypothetical protein
MGKRRSSLSAWWFLLGVSCLARAQIDAWNAAIASYVAIGLAALAAFVSRDPDAD